MIFVTVGTHEQQFNRLIQKVDELKRCEKIQDDVFIQIGYSTYKPKYCKWKKMLTYDEMEKMYREADIIVTHGGPASFMKALEVGKLPIVVPRQVKYDEHVNDHQVEFTKFVKDRLNNIIPIFEIDEIFEQINDYYRNNKKTVDISNNMNFNRQMRELIMEMVI